MVLSEKEQLWVERRLCDMVETELSNHSDWPQADLEFGQVNVLC